MSGAAAEAAFFGTDLGRSLRRIDVHLLTKQIPRPLRFRGRGGGRRHVIRLSANRDAVRNRETLKLSAAAAAAVAFASNESGLLGGLEHANAIDDRLEVLLRNRILLYARVENIRHVLGGA